MAHAPAVLLQHLLVLGLVARQRQLERLRGALREVEELQELVVLAPAVALAVELDLAPRLAPVADRGEALGRAGAGAARGP